MCRPGDCQRARLGNQDGCFVEGLLCQTTQTPPSTRSREKGYGEYGHDPAAWAGQGKEFEHSNQLDCSIGAYVYIYYIYIYYVIL